MGEATLCVCVLIDIYRWHHALATAGVQHSGGPVRHRETLPVRNRRRGAGSMPEGAVRQLRGEMCCLSLVLSDVKYLATRLRRC